MLWVRLGRVWVWAAFPGRARGSGETSVCREGLEVLPAEVGGTEAKVHVGGGKGPPIAFAMAKGNQMAANTFDVQETLSSPQISRILEQSPRKSRGTKNHKQSLISLREGLEKLPVPQAAVLSIWGQFTLVSYNVIYQLKYFLLCHS